MAPINRRIKKIPQKAWAKYYGWLEIPKPSCFYANVHMPVAPHDADAGDLLKH